MRLMQKITVRILLTVQRPPGAEVPSRDRFSGPMAYAMNGWNHCSHGDSRFTRAGAVSGGLPVKR